MSSSREDPYSEYFTVKSETRTLLWSQFSSIEDLESLELKYRPSSPLELILTPSAVQTYSSIFVTLLRIRHIAGVLSKNKLFFQRGFGSAGQSYRRLQFLRHKMQHFINILQGYIASEIHGAAWDQLRAAIKRCKSLKGLLKAHSEYLLRVSVNCFLSGAGSIVLENLKTVFQLVMRFQSLLQETTEDATVRELNSIEADFNQIHRFFYMLTKAMSAKGNYPELFLRLDYNKYLATCIARESN